MTNSSIYSDIKARTGGDIYLGVVGPVRTGKSTFIKKFMETVVLPNITNSDERTRARDEMPQSAGGKTVMTTEPKFVPDTAVEIVLDGNAALRVKMIDCVGYIIPGSLGHTEEERPRMVMTPWSDEEMPFDKAAEIGTAKVINDHSTIGILVTTDGTIGELPRENYIEAEERVVRELREINKPFAIILNSANPDSDSAVDLAISMEEKYKAPVALVNCTDLTEEDIKKILELVLLEFPITELGITIPSWIDTLPIDHRIKKNLYDTVNRTALEITKVGQAREAFGNISDGDFEISIRPDAIDLSGGRVHLCADVPDELFYRILGEETGFEIDGEEALMVKLRELSEVKKEYDKLEKAITEVRENGYGIVAPSLEDMTLEQPEIVKQGGSYGVRLKASAPSIHMSCSKQKCSFVA
ncbi:MAG: stage IV sporulation protein A [Clostridia bacterium]|nr:stage IV sporulation protein A [Clostridia bacterium]